MDKKSFIRAIKEKMPKEFDVTAKTIEAFIKAQSDVVMDVVLAKDEVVIPGICKVATKDVPEKSGVNTLGGVQTEWHKPAHTEGTVKVASVLKKAFEAD